MNDFTKEELEKFKKVLELQKQFEGFYTQLLIKHVHHRDGSTFIMYEFSVDYYPIKLNIHEEIALENIRTEDIDTVILFLTERLECLKKMKITE